MTTLSLPTLYFESGDVAHELGLSYSYIRHLLITGQIQPDAKTKRGVNLFTPETVKALKKVRSKDNR